MTTMRPAGALPPEPPETESARVAREPAPWQPLSKVAVTVAPPLMAVALFDAALASWLMMLGMLLMAFWLLRPRKRAMSAVRVDTVDSSGRKSVDDGLPFALPEALQDPFVRRVLDVKLATVEHGVEVYQGRIREGAPDEAFGYLRRAELARHRMPQIEAAEGGRVRVALMPEPSAAATEVRPRPVLHWGLFAATFFTLLAAGAAQEGFQLLAQPHRIAEALPYAAGLLLILGCHEFGHYFAARRYRMKVTPPFFLPVPFGGIGTFGAFIQLRSPSERRRQLFDVAIAGPLAGIIVALPILFFGLRQSQMLPAIPAAGALNFNLGLGPFESPVLFDFLARLALGDHYISGGHLVLSGLARAGYLGLILTALNLLPVGQLDGGHIAHAMFGRRLARALGLATLIMLAGAGFLFGVPTFVVWATLVLVLVGVRDVPPLDDLTPINRPRRLLGAFAFLLLLGLATPAPQTSGAAPAPFVPGNSSGRATLLDTSARRQSGAIDLGTAGPMSLPAPPAAAPFSRSHSILEQALSPAAPQTESDDANPPQANPQNSDNNAGASAAMPVIAPRSTARGSARQQLPSAARWQFSIKLPSLDGQAAQRDSTTSARPSSASKRAARRYLDQAPSNDPVKWT